MDSGQVTGHEQETNREIIEQAVNPSDIKTIDTVKLDIFQHMRSGLNNTIHNCACDNDINNYYYCIPCKVSCCTKCSLMDHSTHLLVQKEKYSLKSPQIEASFGSLENMLEKDDLFANLKNKRKELIDEMDNTCKKIAELANEWKEKKQK